MTRRSERGSLWDVITHSRRAISFMNGRSYEDYVQDRLLQSAVEREVAVVGEAYGGLHDVRPDLAELLPGDVRAVVGTRNIIIHGYDDIDDARIHAIVIDDLPSLAASATQLLLELGGEPPAD